MICSKHFTQYWQKCQNYLTEKNSITYVRVYHSACESANLMGSESTPPLHRPIKISFISWVIFFYVKSLIRPWTNHLLWLILVPVLLNYKISYRRYGDMMTVYLGSRQIIYLNKYDVVKEAFVKHGNSFTGRPQDLLWSKDICNCIGKFLVLNFRFP